MVQETQELLKKALALPDKERAELAGSLIASLDAVIDDDVEIAWQEEATRRLEEVQSGKVKTIPWSEIQRKGKAVLRGE